MVKIVIPARKGSKGLPGKNRSLFDATARIIPKSLRVEDIIVTTDDEEISLMSDMYEFDSFDRPEILAQDNSSIKDVLVNVIESEVMHEDTIIIMLYLTYPERTWEDIQDALDWFINNDARSMLCKQPVLSNPYLCMLENGNYGNQIVPHDYYRRQDYPKVFEISHFIFISYASEIYHLNNNLYNADTMFYDIGRVHDIDTTKDLMEYEKSIDHITG